jgi:BlaI family penicillinase repressor
VTHHTNLSRRERQIMEIVYRKASASVEDIRAEIPDSPGYSAVRVIVNVLERKGYLRHVKRGKRYIYRPTTPRKKAMQGALRHLLDTYFENSLHRAMAAMIELRPKDLSEEDIRQLAKAIEKSRREGSS